MSIVRLLCLSFPLGSGVICSVYLVADQPSAFGKLHEEAAKVPSLCSWSQVAERKERNHLLVFVSVEEKRSYSLFKCDSINVISLTRTVDDH